MTRAEHLAQGKGLALKLLAETHNSINAFTSMASDLEAHPENAGRAGVDLGFGMLMIGSLSSPHKMADFIRGFN